MKLCYVCGATLAKSEGQCPSCQTKLAVLERIDSAHRVPKFLFGSHKDLKPQLTEPAPQMPKAKPHRSTPTVSDSSTQPQATSRQPLPHRRPVGPPIEDPADMIGDRDQVFVPGPEERTGILAVSKAFFWDLVCCLALNVVILKIVLWVSPRSFADMLRFSLIPLVFVLIGFTVVYFWLFLGIFQTTLGGMIAEIIRRRSDRNG